MAIKDRKRRSDIIVYFNVNLKLLTKLIVYLLVSKLRKFQNARCTDKTPVIVI